MDKAGNPGVNPMLPRPGERHSFGRNLAFLERFLVLDSHDEIAAPLGLRGCGDDHAGIVFKLLNPRGEVGRRVLEANRVQNAGLVRQERRAQFANQLLLGIALRTKSRPLGNALAVETGGMTCGMNQLVVEGVVVILMAMKCGGCRDADYVILGRIAGSKSRVVDGAEPGIFNDCGRLFERL